MKSLIFFSCLLTSFVACNSSSSTSVENFIPGTYECRYSDTMNSHIVIVGSSTLQIKKQAEAGSATYLIDGTNQFHHIENNQPDSPEVHKITWVGFYDDKKNVIETQTGQVLSFDIKNNLMFIGKFTYKKLR